MADDWKEKLGQIGNALSKAEQEKGKKAQAPGSMQRPAKIGNPVKELMKKIVPTTSPRPHSSMPSRGEEGPRFPLQSTTGKTSVKLPNKPSLNGDRITVGLDFGTSFTKVCYRKELGGDDVPVYPLVFGGQKNRSPLYPSTVSVREEKINFGHPVSTSTPKGAIYPHLKVCLACWISNLSANCVSKEICPFEEEGVTPSDLMTLYLAWIMKEARERVPLSLGKSQSSFVYNVGVPVKHLDGGNDRNLTERYHKITYNAWCLSEGLAQGMPLALCRDWLRQIEDNEPPKPEHSPVQLAPETSAAIVSYLNSPDSMPGLYGIIDIGAWTTDISFFRLTDVVAETGTQRLAFYAADVWHSATNAIDDRLVQCIMEFTGIKSVRAFIDGDESMRLRSLRESGELSDTPIKFTTVNSNEDVIKLPGFMIDFSRGVISEAVRRNFGSTFKAAFKKEPKKENWLNFTLFVIGGGSNEECFSSKICARYEPYRVRVRSDIVGSPALQIKGPLEVFKRMAVSAGLSYPLGIWPDQLRPSQVSEWTKQPMANIPDADDEPG